MSTNTSPEYRHCYVHVPFCSRRCSYCDFAIAVRRNVPVADYLHGLAAEVRARDVAALQMQLDTLYFGGGTPSALGADGVTALMRIMRACSTVAADAEVTLEANPEHMSEAAAAAWREAGINRLSVGIQSFDDSVLAWMHRGHTGADAERAVLVARDAGIHAISVDLIFALPSVLARDWQADIERALALEPDHVSLYGLTIEQRTPLGRWAASGTVAEAPEEGYEEQFLLAHDLLTRAGYEHYEVSNFAKPGKRARHNSAYWRGVPYLGLGPSAHGYDGAERRWNLAAYPSWLGKVGEGADPLDGSEVLTASDRTTETVYLGLRTRDGLTATEHDRSLIQQWSDAGWLESTGEEEAGTRVRCTPQGWLRLDGLAADLTALRSHW